MLLNPLGYDFLGSTKMGSASASSAVVTIAPRDLLLVQVRITGYGGGGGIASLRFNGDTGTNYWSRHISIAAGGVTLTNAQTVSTTMARLHPAATTLQRSSLHAITNNLGTSKIGTVTATTSTGAAATAGILEFGSFEWVNTTAQITSIQLVEPSSVTMGAGSGFAVFGRNL